MKIHPYYVVISVFAILDVLFIVTPIVYAIKYGSM